jgi:hypothetical protein
MQQHMVERFAPLRSSRNKNPEIFNDPGLPCKTPEIERTKYLLNFTFDRRQMLRCSIQVLVQRHTVYLLANQQSYKKGIEVLLSK